MKDITTVNKAARLALIMMLWERNHDISSQQIADLTGICLRSAQRDLKVAGQVKAKLDEILNILDNPKPVVKTYSVDEVSAILHLHPRHVRLLIRNMGIGSKPDGFLMRLTEDDVEKLKNRPGKRERRD